MGRATATLDARTVRALKPGEWARAPIAGKRGGGILEARALANGAITFYLRVTTAAGKRERVSLGAVPYREAVKRASELSLRYQHGERDLPAALREEQAALDRAREEARARADRTLGALLTAYCEGLDRARKRSATEVRRALVRHVQMAAPELWRKPLDEVGLDDLVGVVSRPAAAGHYVMAQRLRSYLRAAFAAGIAAGQRPGALESLRELRLDRNPALLLATIEPPKVEAGEGEDEPTAELKRALSLAELRAYWRRIEAAPGVDGAMLRFHLLTGGQRLAQLARATWGDYDSDSAALMLRDGKGRRVEARAHFVPLIPAALDAAEIMRGGKFVFSATGGKTGVSKHVFAARLRPVVAAMQAAGELEREPFTAADLRRTVETRLAPHAAREVRAHLQSHGLAGVQQRNYNMYDYLDEKRAALETLYRLCTGASADVVPLRSAQ